MLPVVVTVCQSKATTTRFNYGGTKVHYPSLVILRTRIFICEMAVRLPYASGSRTVLGRALGLGLGLANCVAIYVLRTVQSRKYYVRKGFCV